MTLDLRSLPGEASYRAAGRTQNPLRPPRCLTAVMDGSVVGAGAVRHEIDHLAHPRLAFPQGFFRPLALGDVADL